MYTINFTELQREVQDKWEQEGLRITEEIEITNDPYTITETVLKDDYDAIINDAEACVKELGFDSLASYVASKNEPQQRTVSLGYALISKTRTKFFYEKDGVELEFYIDRDPSTNTAKLWIRPGVYEGIMPFLGELLITINERSTCKK